LKHICFILILFSVFSQAQIPPTYYVTAQGNTGFQLKTALHDIIKNHTVIPYSNLFSAFPKTDAKSNGKVWDMYSYDPVLPQPYEFTFGSNECGVFMVEGDCFDRSRVWPQAWFNGQSGPDSDLFNVYPTDALVNSVRANYPYGTALLVSFVSLNGSKLGTCIDPGYSLTVFEPTNEFKGDIARSYLYMTVRYYGEDITWGTSDATNKATILPWQLNVLMNWHHQDPVSAKEIARNDSIFYKYQHNRNPFIDHPEYADSIWTYVASVHENKMDLTSAFSVYPNPSNDVFHLKYNSSTTQEIDYIVQNITGSIIEQKNKITSDQININAKDWPNGVYIVSLKNKNGICNLKLIKN